MAWINQQERNATKAKVTDFKIQKLVDQASP